MHRIIPALDVIMALIDDLLPIPPPPTPPPPPPTEKREELEKQTMEVVCEIGIIDNAIVELQRAFRQGNGRRAELYRLIYLDRVIVQRPSLEHELERRIHRILAKLPTTFSF